MATSFRNAISGSGLQFPEADVAPAVVGSSVGASVVVKGARKRSPSASKTVKAGNRRPIEVSKNRPRVEAMTDFSDLLRESIANGVPGDPKLAISRWAIAYGLGVVDGNLVQAWANAARLPNIDRLVYLSVLLKKSGVQIGVYDLLISLFNGIYEDFCDQLRRDGMLGEGENFLPDEDFVLTPDAPTPDPLPPTPEQVVIDFAGLSFSDRCEAAPALLDMLGRDHRAAGLMFSTSADREFRLLSLLTNDALKAYDGEYEKMGRGKNPGDVQVPPILIKSIAQGDMEKARSIITIANAIALADRIPNIDGERGDLTLFYSLLQDGDRNKAAAHMEKRGR